ncbi:hypothetical protein MMC27_007681 [Xylographa pallens]|nr:hypothetical protein [Xylographa pallens]
MSTPPECRSATRLQKTIGKIRPGVEQGKKADPTAGPRASQKSDRKAVAKKTVKFADPESDNSSSQGVSIEDDDDKKPRDGPQGETSVQRRRREASAVVDNDWVPQRDANGHPLQPLITRGFYNRRNMCYRNSILQCLFHEPAFAQWMRFHHNHNTCTVDNCVACEITGLMELYWSADSEQHKPFRRALSSLHLNLNLNGWEGEETQEDAHDLYIFMARTIHNQLHHQRRQFGLVSHTLSLRTRRTTFFKCCSRVLTSYDNEYTLAVNCKEGEREPQEIRHLIKQAMKGYVELACSVCGDGISNRKSPINIEAAPAVLAIQIRRFSWDQVKEAQGKITEIVKFGPHLDLSRYYLPNKPVRKQSLRYELVGVISHAGTLDRGHYTATVRQPGKISESIIKSNENAKRGRPPAVVDLLADGEWKLADDSEVTDSSLAAVEQTDANPGVFTPYMLFYKRY